MADWTRTFRRGQRRAVFLTVRALVRSCGFGRTHRLGTALATLQYYLGGSTRRRSCLHDLALLQHLEPGDPRVTQQLREAYRAYTVAALEVLAMFDRKLDAEVLRTRCRIDGLERLETVRSGSGAILLATHSGNTLLFAAQLASAGLPVTVVYRHARMMSADFFSKGLPLYGIEGVLANEGIKAYAKMLKALRRNRFVFVMMDQGVKLAKDGVMARFLGKDMPMPGGPAQLSRRAGAPILPIVTLAAEPVWHFAIDPPVERMPGNTLEEDVRNLVRMTEKQVLARPQLWSWHHRRWRKFPLAAASTPPPLSARGESHPEAQ